MVLYINACVRKESRTNRLAKAVLERLGEYEEIKLETLDIKPLDGECLANRTALIAKGEYDNEMFDLARQFAAADTIVMAAPYWDGSFPAILKTYIENIYVTGIVSKYDDTGRPQGLCRAGRLYYVTTAGGRYNPAYSYDYLKDLANNMLGIAETELVFAEMLDIVGNDAEEILVKAISEIITAQK